MIGLLRLGEYLVPYLSNLASRIDQTMLKYDKGFDEYRKFVESSEPYGFRALVVPPLMVKHIAPITRMTVAGVAGFPFSFTSLKSRKADIEAVAEGGGKEVDIVINLILLKSGRFEELEKETMELVQFSKDMGLGTKIIIETSILTDEEIKRASRIVLVSGADFIKTNTGFGPRGVNLRDIHLIRSAVGEDIRVKASGGIRTALDAAVLLASGADIIGASRGIQLVEEAKKILEV